MTITYGTYLWRAVPADRSHGPGLAAECQTLIHVLYADQRARDAAETGDVCTVLLATLDQE